jgi:hypothetical protein
VELFVQEICRKNKIEIEKLCRRFGKNQHNLVHNMGY